MSREHPMVTETFRYEKSLKLKVEAEAAKRDMTVSAIIRVAIMRMLCKGCK